MLLFVYSSSEDDAKSETSAELFSHSDDDLGSDVSKHPEPKKIAEYSSSTDNVDDKYVYLK